MASNGIGIVGASCTVWLLLDSSSGEVSALASAGAKRPPILSGLPAGWRRRVPIPIEHATRVEFLCENDKLGCGLGAFRKRRRIGNLQVQGRDVRMQKIATIERTCDCHEALHFRAEVDRHAVAPA